MHGCAVAGPNLCRPDPLVLGEMRRDRNVLILYRSRCRDLKLLLHLEDGIRGTESPTLGKRAWRRSIAGVAPWCTLIHPGEKHVDLFLKQDALIGQTRVAWFGEPRRHFPE